MRYTLLYDGIVHCGAPHVGSLTRWAYELPNIMASEASAKSRTMSQLTVSMLPASKWLVSGLSQHVRGLRQRISLFRR